jgi:hypothetical protein
MPRRIDKALMMPPRIKNGPSPAKGAGCFVMRPPP